MASTGQQLWYQMCRIPFWMIAQFGFGLRTRGGSRIPKRGKALLLANHQSFLDPLLVGLATWRPLRYLGRKTLFRSSLFAKLITSLGCVPIDQEGVAVEGLRITLDLLEQGEAVLVFPEGVRTPTGVMSALKPGVSLLIKRSGAPVIPIGIAGAYEAYPRGAKAPILSPLFMPDRERRIAVVVDKPIENARLTAMGRQEQLGFLFERIAEVQAQADLLRR